MQASRAPAAKERENTAWNYFWYGNDNDPPVIVALVMFAFIFSIVWFFGIQNGAFQDLPENS